MAAVGGSMISARAAAHDPPLLRRRDSPVRINPFSEFQSGLLDGKSIAWYLVDAQQSLTDIPNEDVDFWWHSTGSVLSILLLRASYSLEEQIKNLQLYRSIITPELGQGVDGHWKSFMTDHHNPVELSWQWNIGQERPTVRFSFEPIAFEAGTPMDPFNQHRTEKFISTHCTQLPGCDLRWHTYFTDNILSYDETVNYAQSTHQSRTFLALEFAKSGLVLKAYYMPEFKAQALGCTNMELINTAITSLPDCPQILATAYQYFQLYLTTEHGRVMQPEIVANDCVEIAKARVKVYMRSPQVSYESVVDALCLGDAEERQRLQGSLKEFRKLWDLVFELDPQSNGDLQQVQHRTAGMLYHFGCSVKSARPSVKVYLPIRHYARSDRAAAGGLQRYMQSTSRADFSQEYIEGLNDILQSTESRSETGLQTYFTVAVTGNGLDVTSYLAPKVFHAG